MKYPLSGKLYCEKHKCYYVRRIRHYKNKKDVIFWYCSSFHKTGKKDCVLACLKEEDLYEALFSAFKGYEIYKEEICKELLFLYQECLNEEDGFEEKVLLMNELKSLEMKKDKLIDLALDGAISKENLEHRKLIIEKQIEGIRTKLEELEDKKSTAEKSKINYKVLKEHILKQLVITKENLENYIEELLDKIIVVE